MTQSHVKCDGLALSHVKCDGLALSHVTVLRARALSLSGGHYHAMCSGRDGSWYHLNDSTVSKSGCLHEDHLL